MNLIEVYIQEVTRRLPEKSRNDIALELRSTIEDMLPDDYNEDDIKKVLEKLGNPALLASGYHEKPMYLIGPRYFDLYVTLLKMILPIASSIAIISMVASYFFSFNGEEALLKIIIDVFVKGIVVLIEVGIQVFFWFTVVFAIIERVDNGKDNEPLTMNYSKWTPEDLERITYIPKKRSIPKGEVYFGLLWAAIWAAVYFNAEHLIGIYVNKGNGLEFVTPAFNHNVLMSFWLIIVVIIGLEITISLYKLLKGQWTYRLAIINLIYEIIATVSIIVILNNPNIFNHEFTSFMAGLFTITEEQFTNRFIGGVIFMFIIFGGYNIYDGFRKAKIIKTIEEKNQV